MGPRRMWPLSLPVALAQMQPVPPVPSGSACAPATADAPCQHSCGSFSFDLTGFAAAHPTAPYFTANDDQQHTYYVSCRAGGFRTRLSVSAAISAAPTRSPAPAALTAVPMYPRLLLVYLNTGSKLGFIFSGI